MKRIILGFAIGFIIAGTISGVVAYNYNAKDIEYNPSDTNWHVNSVEDALKDLKKQNNSVSNTGVICIALSGNKTTIGSKYVCNPGDNKTYNFNILNISGNTVQMIMDRNIAQVADYTTAMDYFKTGSGTSTANSWTKVQSVDIPSKEDIINSAGGESFNDKCYLFDYLEGSTGYGCSTSISGVSGYWLDGGCNNGSCPYVFRQGFIATSVSHNSYLGVRPSIVVSKSQLNQ